MELDWDGFCLTLLTLTLTTTKSNTYISYLNKLVVKSS